MAIDMKKMVEDFDGMLEAVTGDDDNRGYIVVADQTGNEHGYIQFKPEVVQYFNDDLGDVNGLWSGLAQDIAKEIFHSESWATGVSFCTTKITEPEEEHNGEAAETAGQ